MVHHSRSVGSTVNLARSGHGSASVTASRCPSQDQTRIFLPLASRWSPAHTTGSEQWSGLPVPSALWTMRQHRPGAAKTAPS